MDIAGCPLNSFRFNATLCACVPGLYMDTGTGQCKFLEDQAEWRELGSKLTKKATVGTTTTALLGEVLPMESVEKVVESEGVMVRATLILVLFWFAFCIWVRFGRVDEGKTVWFRALWWISRMDVRFSTMHHLEDRKVVRKRKTELGGTFSVASWILFVGLLSALLYQVITRRSIEIHRVRPANAPDLLSFVNDMEFSITTVSSMSCSHLRAPHQLVIGSPGSVYYKVVPLSSYINYTCYSTSRGPTVSLQM